MTEQELERRQQTLALIGGLTVALATYDLDEIARRHLERNQADLIRRIVAESVQDGTATLGPIGGAFVALDRRAS